VASRKREQMKGGRGRRGGRQDRSYRPIHKNSSEEGMTTRKSGREGKKIGLKT